MPSTNPRLQRFGSQPWAMHPRFFAELYARAVQGWDDILPTVEVEPAEAEAEEERGVLVIPIRGTIVHHRTDAYDYYGFATATERLVDVLDRAEADPSVSGVVLDIDSGGGMAMGTPEAAERIHQFRQAKPIVAVANGFAASAAYYLGAAASELYVIPSGEVGSIGTLMMHQDVTGMLESIGVKVEILRATEAENKARMNPFEPLTEEERAHAIGQLDTINDRFLSDVARFRGMERDAVAAISGNGRTFLAADALESGLVDGIKTLREVVAAMEEADRGGEAGIREERPAGLEVRSLAGLEVREAEAETGPRLEGVALRFGSLSVDLGGFREEFAEGAFAESLGADDLRVLWQHDGRFVFGRVKAGTARIWAEDGALRYEASPPDAQWARDAMESIRRGDVDQNSFAFVVEKGGEKWERRGGEVVRTVTKARLIECGPQTIPAYTDTTVAVRGMQAWAGESALPEPAATPLLNLARERLRLVA